MVTERTSDIARSNVQTVVDPVCAMEGIVGRARPYTSKSLYMMVKKTWRKRLTALSNTARRKSHASPVIVAYVAARG